MNIKAQKAVISRVKQDKRSGMFAWSWLYSVSLDGAEKVTIGNRLDEARSWAKQRAVKVEQSWK